MEEKNYATVESLTAQANEQYLKYMNEGRLRDILKVMGLMPDYTVMNDVLIMSQMPNVKLVKRLTGWNKDGRKVKEHQKSLKIISPCLKKYNQDYTDENGNVFTKGIEKLDLSVGHVFDISQTEGREYPYLNTNKETIAKFFEAAKNSLERTAKGYKFEYVDQEPFAKMDKENKIVYIKDGLSIDELINTLINQTTRVLIDSRRPEGITSKTVENIDDIEYNCALYAIKSKLGLNLPDFNDDAITNLSDEEKLEFKNNLQKVRSVSMQLLSNFETAIEIAIRGLEKQTQKVEEEVKAQEKTEEVKAPAEKKTAKKTSSKSKKAESEVE